MKQQIGFYLFAAAAMLLIPSTVLLLHPDSAQDAQPPSAITSAPKEESSQQIQAETKCYRVLDISSGTVLEVPVRDYLIGVVCAEMPATFESEALKAQAVAALCEGVGTAHTAGGGVTGHQDHPGVLGTGGGADGFFADLHKACLFGKADH